jgi:UDP-N-acetylmuramate--alanine ligase
MSGIAEILHNLGYSVQGSDIVESANVKRLSALNIEIFIGHRSENLQNSKVVVNSSAVKPDNPEIVEARARLIPVVPRAEMLAEIMRLKWGVAVAGTHGKTTTTSIIAAVLDAGQIDPTVINGGIINAYGTNARLGGGDWIVVEADESDGTFMKLPATIAVVTNIDPEHLDYYGDFDALKSAFVTFVQNIPFYGFATICIDDSEVQALIPQVSDRRIVTYGMSPQADIRAIDISADPAGSQFTVMVSHRATGSVSKLGRFTIPMVGNHNICNALAAISIALEMEIEANVITLALSEFKGVKRRFTRTGMVNDVTVIDDYGHHPVEIAAVLAAARTSARRNVIAVVQPHRYSRLSELFDEFCTCFNDADTVIVADIYAAGESPIPGIDQNAMVDGLRGRGHRHIVPLEDAESLPALIATIAKPGDFVVCLGAGTITTWANNLPTVLTTIWGNSPIAKAKGT